MTRVLTPAAQRSVRFIDAFLENLSPAERRDVIDALHAAEHPPPIPARVVYEVLPPTAEPKE